MKTITTDKNIIIPKSICHCHCGKSFEVDVDEIEKNDIGFQATECGFTFTCADEHEPEDYQSLLVNSDKIYRYLQNNHIFEL